MQRLAQASSSSLTGAAPAAPEDWRILRLLSSYRLLLVASLIVLFETGYAQRVIPLIQPEPFRLISDLYGLVALLLMAAAIRRWPRLNVQVHWHFVCDVAALCLIVHASGGVPAGLGVLVIIPAVASAMVVPPRIAAAYAAVATIAMFVEELVRHPGPPYDLADFTATGVLGLMFFAATMAANTVAQRARFSEALAERVGSEFEDLSVLNDTVLKSMQTGVIVVDHELFVKSANAAAQRLLGSRYALRGRRLNLEAPLLGLRLQRWLEDGVSDNEPIPPHPGGLEVAARISRLSGHRHAILILLDDAASLRERAQQMKLAALGRLSAGIAHEIRNPLSAIKHASQLLAESETIVWEDRRLLDMVERHSQRIDKIIGDVLALSRRGESNPTRLALLDWLSRAVALYHEGFPNERRVIQIGDVAANLEVRFDPSHLQQVLFNLWDNAFQHGGQAERATVVTLQAGSEQGRRVWLEVSDNGPGIPSANLDRMFEPFFTTSHKGTGLGLYLTRELCEYNQARISYQPQGPGACFRIIFPGEA